jgi:hypothetical protein
MTFPKVIKTVEHMHQARFASGLRIYKTQFIDVGDRTVAVEFLYLNSGDLHRVRQRELRDEDRELLAN